MTCLRHSISPSDDPKWTFQIPSPHSKEKPMTRRAVEGEALLTPAEVAALFRVDPKTVTRWAKAGKLTSLRTLGGHRRYRESEIRSLLDGEQIAS
jgi:excisionase family DNA binding protein